MSAARRHGSSERERGSVRVERLERHTDARGVVFEPTGPDALVRQRNVHVVLTAPDCVRGNHVHQESSEILAVHGPALVRFREGAALRDVHVEPDEAVAFTFPPGVPHAVLNTGRTMNLLISFRDREHDRGSGDTRRVELIPPAEAKGPQGAR